MLRVDGKRVIAPVARGGFSGMSVQPPGLGAKRHAFISSATSRRIVTRHVFVGTGNTYAVNSAGHRYQPEPAWHAGEVENRSRARLAIRRASATGALGAAGARETVVRTADALEITSILGGNAALLDVCRALALPTAGPTSGRYSPTGYWYPTR